MKDKTCKAIALLYPEGEKAPFISAKAKGEIAERMLRIAEEENVHIVRDEITANVLSLYDIGEYVPQETYEVLAGVFAFILKARETTDGKNKE